MTHPTDALRLVPDEKVRELAMQLARSIAGLGYPVGMGVAPPEYVCMKAAQGIFDLYLTAAPASPLPEGGGKCSGISGQLDPRLVEWGYTSLDEAITHLGKLLDNQTAFDGLAAPTGAK